jgi:dihydroneopterin aldolase
MRVPGARRPGRAGPAAVVSIGRVTDTVSIRDLRVSAVIGVHDRERETEQPLVFGVDMAADAATAAARDDIAAALDYSSVAQTIRSVVTTGKFRLIETAAERVAERLREDYRLGWVRVEVLKPLPGEGYTAAVTIERGNR